MLSTPKNRKNKNFFVKLNNYYKFTIYRLTDNRPSNVTKETGEILYLHRNTVQYRINNVKQRLNYDITKMPEAYTIYRAVALERLRLLEQKNKDKERKNCYAYT